MNDLRMNKKVLLLILLMLCGCVNLVNAQKARPFDPNHKGADQTGVQILGGGGPGLDMIPTELEEENLPPPAPTRVAPAAPRTSVPPNVKAPPRTTKPSSGRPPPGPPKPSIKPEPTSESWIFPDEPYTEEQKKNMAQAAATMGGLGLIAALAWWFGMSAAKTGTAIGTGIGTSKIAAAFPPEPIAPPAPEPEYGTIENYVDANGNQCQQVFDGRNWVERETFHDMQVARTSNQEWQDNQFQRQINHDTEFDRNLEQSKENLKQDLKEIHERNAQERREIQKVLVESSQSEVTRAALDTQKWDTRTELAENFKTIAIDTIAIPLLGASTGGVGWVVGTAYTVGSEVVGGATEGIVESGTIGEAVKKGLQGGAIGALKGGVNVLIGEGLNAAGAIVSQRARNALQSIPLRSPGAGPLPAAAFHESLPIEDLNKMLGNFRAGDPLLKNVDQKLSKVSVSRAWDLVSGKGAPSRGAVHSDKAFQKAVDHFNGMKTEARKELGWGGVGAVRGQVIDARVSQHANDAIFGGNT